MTRTCSECFELCELRETMSPGLLGFESGLVTRDQLRRELQSARGAAREDERQAWVPSAERERAKEALRDQWLQSSLTKLRNRAGLVYREFLAGAGQGLPSQIHDRAGEHDLASSWLSGGGQYR